MSKLSTGLDRRQFIEVAVASCISSLVAAPAFAKSDAFAASGNKLVNDVSQLNPIKTATVLNPTSSKDIQSALRAWSGSVSVGGGRYSMGGQIAAASSLHFDMRAFKNIIALDVPNKVIRVQAGITWRDIQDLIDPHNLSIKIMQSYSNFTVGGSLSVNCHGRYVGKGPIINSVRAVQLITVNGEVLELSRTQQPALFSAIFGGYGGLGIITEVELDLEDNTKIERIVSELALADYPQYYRENILSNKQILLHNADLLPPDYATPRVVTWSITEKPLTHTERLVPRGLDYTFEKNAIWSMTELPGGIYLRKSIDKLAQSDSTKVTWRNREASLDAASLEPRSRTDSTYLLQEYFIPVKNFQAFAKEMTRILQTRDAQVLNVSIRHSPADKESLMTWATTEVFSFVIYYKQKSSQRASKAVRVWTRELIDAALANNGRYYLPYRLDATKKQFLLAYPEAKPFAALKAKIDPENRLRNQLWDKYLPKTFKISP
jgi:FAD/FMN-containing dehydrogenase